MYQSKRYDLEFKINVVKLYKGSNLTIPELSVELSIPEATLRNWIKTYELTFATHITHTEQLKPVDSNVIRLTRELIHVKQERDRYKKALNIFTNKITNNNQSHQTSLPL